MQTATIPTGSTRSIAPSRKYAEQGGPSTPDVIALLSKTGESSSANLRTFILFLLFNYLMGATDAHVKNYSSLLGEGGSRGWRPSTTSHPSHPTSP